MHRESYLSEALLKLAKLPAIDAGKVEEALESITVEVSKELDVDRVSVWFFNADSSVLECSHLFERATDTHSSGTVLLAKDFPKYFKYLIEARVLSASEATSHPHTDEFTDVYFNPLQIISMLDAPIRIHGGVIGVICCETVSRRKNWTPNDEIFVSNISDYISRVLQARERVLALERLEHMNANLEKLIQERTVELEEQRERSLQSSKMALLGEMAGSIAHEINNPLAIIIGFLKVLKESEGKEPQEFRFGVINSIEKTAHRIEKIVKGLRFFARDAKFDALYMASVEQIIEDTLSLCREKCKVNNCDIILDLEPGIFIFCQPVSISQAILNLVSNSFDAVEHKPIKWIKISCYQKEMVEIVITDSGDGISHESLGKVLLLFYTTKPAGKGTGLGLPIVKGIVESHNGSFEIDNSGIHTKFIMKFPLLKKECA